MKSVMHSPPMRHVMSLLLGLSFHSACMASAKKLSAPDFNRQFSHLRSIQSIQSEFSQVRTISKWQTQLKASGIFSLKKGQSSIVMWEIKKPAYTVVKITPEGLFLKEEKQTSAWKKIENKQMSQQLQSLFSWLSFDGKTIVKDYEIFKNAPRIFKLIPLNKKNHFSYMTIQLDKTLLLKNIILTEKNQDSISIEFKNTKVVK